MQLRNIKVVKDRKGAPRYYFQVKGRPLIRLPNGPTDSAEFHAAWEAARVASNVNDEPTPEQIRRAIARALRKATHRARSKGRDVSVTLDDLEAMYRRQRGKCALTGIPLSLDGKKPGRARNPWMLSIDRIESTGGYVAGNVHLVTTMANVAKAEFTMKDFRRMCQSAAERWQV